MNKTKLEYERERTEKIIEQKFQASYMNDEKWVKLISQMVEKFELVKNIQAKLVWDSNIRHLIIHEHTDYNFDYYPKAMEAMITGYPAGWYSYKEIEWLNFPDAAEVLVNPDNLKAGKIKVVQDLAAIKEAIQSLGKFELELNENSLKLYAYK